jgi:hypothetical protein
MSMRYKLLGRTGLRVSELCLGAIVPILGARRREQIEENLGALELELTDDELARLEQVSRPDLGFPYDFGADRLAYGDTRPLIDDHRHPKVRPSPWVRPERGANDD